MNTLIKWMYFFRIFKPSFQILKTKSNNFRILLLLAGVVIYPPAAQSQFKYIIGLQVNYINFRNGTLADGRSYNLTPLNDTIWPGDTIGIESGRRNIYLRIKNLAGAEGQPITLINTPGRVEIFNPGPGGAMSIKKSKYIRLSGSGDSAYLYGIRLDSTYMGTSLSLDELTSDVEIHHVEICNSGFAGLMAKTDPGCDPASHRENFTMKNLHFHHNYIHHTAGEGMYIGYCNYGPVTRNCSGNQITVYAHEIHHLRVHDNLITYTGYDGIQVGCATYDIEVYNNEIIKPGTWDNATSKVYGMEGIIVGGGSTGRYYNNRIIDPYGIGISVFGTGDIHIYNNLITRPGRYSSLPVNKHFCYGIYAADRITTPGASCYYINNTIISPRTSGIKIASTQTINNRVYNNIIVDPSSKHQFGNYGNNWMKSCFQFSANNVITANNYIDTVYYASYHGLPGSVDPYFSDAAGMDFHLLENAVMVDAGLACDTVSGFAFDADQMPRPSGTGWDIGAYEYMGTGQVYLPQIQNTPEMEMLTSTLKSTTERQAEWIVWSTEGRIWLKKTGHDNAWTEWKIYSLDGSCLATGQEVCCSSPVSLTTGNLPSGLYVLSLYDGNAAISKKVMMHP